MVTMLCEGWEWVLFLACRCSGVLLLVISCGALITATFSCYFYQTPSRKGWAFRDGHGRQNGQFRGATLSSSPIVRFALRWRWRRAFERMWPTWSLEVLRLLLLSGAE